MKDYSVETVTEATDAQIVEHVKGLLSLVYGYRGELQVSGSNGEACFNCEIRVRGKEQEQELEALFSVLKEVQNAVTQRTFPVFKAVDYPECKED